MAFCIIPSGPLLCATFCLVAATKHERRRQAALKTPPGYVLVGGTIREEGQTEAPVIAVWFELESVTYKGQTSYREKLHHVEARPFTVATEGGRLVEVEPDQSSSTRR